MEEEIIDLTEAIKDESEPDDDFAGLFEEVDGGETDLEVGMEDGVWKLVWKTVLST